jgi:TDG/mug DNA glycosylase family protein
VSVPAADDLAASVDKTVPDLVSDDLVVLFCGINPGRYSGMTGNHFAGPGNRFWRVLHLAGFTATELRPDQGATLLASGIGITNLVARTTATAAEIGREEYAGGADHLRRVVATSSASVVAVLGIGAYRLAFDRRAALGRQPGFPSGAVTFALPNPSGLQARYQLVDLVEMFSEVLAAVPEHRRARFGRDVRAG